MNFTRPLSMIRSNFKNEKQCWTSTDGIASDTGKCQSRNHVQATFRPQRRRTANPCAVPCSEATRRSANGSERRPTATRYLGPALLHSMRAPQAHLGAAQRQRRVVIRPRLRAVRVCVYELNRHTRGRGDAVGRTFCTGVQWPRNALRYGPNSPFRISCATSPPAAKPRASATYAAAMERLESTVSQPGVSRFGTTR